MVQPCNPKEVQRTLHYRVATYRERNFETGRSAKELLTKPALRAFLCLRIPARAAVAFVKNKAAKAACDMSR